MQENTAVLFYTPKTAIVTYKIGAIFTFPFNHIYTDFEIIFRYYFNTSTTHC